MEFTLFWPLAEKQHEGEKKGTMIFWSPFQGN